MAFEIDVKQYGPLLALVLKGKTVDVNGVKVDVGDLVAQVVADGKLDSSDLQVLMPIALSLILPMLLHSGGGVQPPVPQPIPVPVPTPTPQPAPVPSADSDPGPMVVQLNRVSVRNPREGNISALIDAGTRALMVGDRVFADSNELKEDGSGYGEEFKTPADEILWQFFYGDDSKPDLEVRGDETKEVSGKHWLVSGQGLRKLAESAGFSIIGKLQEGTPGSSKAAIVCIHGTPNGITSNPIVFAKAD